MIIKKLTKQTMAVGLVGQKVVVYGDNETGKTTVAIEIGKAICKQVSSNPEASPLVLALENGTNASDDFYLVDGTDYRNVREVLSDFCNPRNKDYIMENMPVLIVDGAEKIPTIAKNYVTTKKEIETLGDLDWGKGFDIFKSYTDAPFIKLMALSGITVIFIFHTEISTDEKTKQTYKFPSGSMKENGICKYIKDNSDFAFYLEKPVMEDGRKAKSRAYCDDTVEHFGRNRYSEGAETFDIDFNAQSVIDYVEACGKNLAKKKGVTATTVVEKQQAVTKKMNHGELVAENSRVGKILFSTSAKDRCLELMRACAEGTPTGKISEVDDDNKLADLLSDLNALASDKGIDIG